MIYKYSFIKSIGCSKYNKCYYLKIFSFFKKGEGFIFYKIYLDKKIINSIKFFIFYFNINFLFYNFYLNIYPGDILKLDSCIDLSLFFSIFFSFFKINFILNILILGFVDLKSGKILKFGNNFLKNVFTLKINNIDLIIIPYENFFFKKTIVLKFSYLFEIYKFFKRCLTQRKSGAITKHMSGVQIS